MRSNVAIRPCRVEECATVLEVRRRAHPNSDTFDSLERLARMVRDHGDLVLVAETEGKIVGCVIGGWNGWEGHIDRLAVLPDHKRKGIARALVQEVERRLVAKGARRISLLVHQGHPEALAFWDSLDGIGYRRDPRMVRYMKNV